MPNIKYYTNPARKDKDKIDRVPQYQQLGIQPEEYKSNTLPGNVLVVRNGVDDSDLSRNRKPSIRQPYAEVAESPIGIGKGVIPNVGNNMEQTWTALDGEIVDDITGEVVNIDPEKMIDNNEFINPNETEDPKAFLSRDELQNILKQGLSSELSSINDNDYILLVDGEIIAISSLEDIQEQASSFVFGENELCEGQPVPIENITILKKVKIKIGLFID